MTDYDYTIYPDNSPTIFKQVCADLERNIASIIRDRLAIDVDGSTIQLYHLADADGAKREILVYDDYDVGAVYVKSQIDLDGIIQKEAYLK